MDFFALMLTPFSHMGILIGGTLFFFILGWLWYNPITPVGMVWIKYFPMPKKIPSNSQMAIMMLFQLFMGFILAHTVMTLWIFIFQNNYHMFNHSIATDKISREGMADYMIQIKIVATLFIIKVFMGFVFIKDLGHWYFEQKPFPLVLVGVGYYLVGTLGVCGLLMYFF